MADNKKLQALQERRDQLNAQIQALKAREQSQKRKDDTRRKVVIGGVLLRAVESGEVEHAWLERLLDRHVTDMRTRALLELPVDASCPPEKQSGVERKPLVSTGPISRSGA